MNKGDIDELKALIKSESVDQKAATKAMEAALIKKFDDFTVKIEKSVSSVSAKTEQLALKVKRIENKVDQFANDDARTRNLIVNGIPSKEGEDLAKIFKSLATNLGYEAEPEAKFFRFRGESETRPIIIKFPTEFHKDDFLQRYFKVAKQLLLPKISGFRKENNSRIYLQHDFSPDQYKINKMASKLRASGDVKAIRITHGKVGIKFSDNGPLMYFNSAGALEKEG